VARDRIDLLCDRARSSRTACSPTRWPTDLPADGVVTGVGDVDGRPVVVMANDPTVKAGSWGARTVEKIVRLTEAALREELPIVWLVDSAGARITDQVELFPGRRGAGRIFHNQVKLSGRVPQVCCLFGPSAAGGAYIPAFCDMVIMVEGNASMYLGSPRMAEMVIGEGDAGGDRRGAHALHRVRLRRQPGRRRRRRDRRQAPYLTYLPAVTGATPRRCTKPVPPVRPADRRCRARRGDPRATTCTR
jgi:acetyl-CoA carboxylase carboxyltransferase component